MSGWLRQVDALRRATSSNPGFPASRAPRRDEPTASRTTCEGCLAAVLGDFGANVWDLFRVLYDTDSPSPTRQ